MSFARYIDIQYKITNPTYLGDKYNGEVYSTINFKDSGGSVGNYKTPTILSSIGEFLERERLIKVNLGKANDSINLIEGYSLLNNRIIKVSMDKIIGGGSAFVDTTGMASHTNSFKCLFNAVGEFIERQSYIFNYLSKGNSKLINFNEGTTFEPILNNMRGLKFYEISLIRDYYVVLGKGVYDGRFYIGLGSSNSIDQAISQSISEIMQLKMIYNSKNSNKDMYKKNEESYYHHVFQKISTERLIEAYKYLDKNCKIYNYKDFVFKEFAIESIFRKLNKQYSMDPLIFFLKPIRDINTLKIIKVLDINWFPHMFPKTYNENIYDYVENVTNFKLDRKCNFIPFP